MEKTKNSHLDLENGLLNLKQRDKELWYRAKSGEVFIVRPTRSQDVFELWQPGNLMSRHHYRELASWLYAKEVNFAGEKKQPEDTSRVSKERERDASKDFEKNLIAKVNEFVREMDTELMQQGKDYAYRFGAISSHMSMVVNAFIEDLRGDLVLSEAERKSMIKKSISSIEIAD